MSSKGYYTVFGEYKTINDNVIEHMSDDNDDINCPEGMKCIPANEYQNMESQILEKMMRKMQNMDDRLNAISVAASDQQQFGDEVEHSGHSMSLFEKQHKIIDSEDGINCLGPGNNYKENQEKCNDMLTKDEICENNYEDNKEMCNGHLKNMIDKCNDESYYDDSKTEDSCSRYREIAKSFCGDPDFDDKVELCKDFS